MGGFRSLREDEGPGDKVFGVEMKSTFRIDTGKYLGW